MQVVEVYSTSATHQLRCLVYRSLLSYLSVVSLAQSLTEGQARLRSELIALRYHSGGGAPPSEVWRCLDYCIRLQISPGGLLY